jgi:general secretion pathway protein J
MTWHRQACLGFTLLELLVALAIFSLVAVTAYSGLAAVLDTEEALDDHSGALSELQLAMQLMHRDLLQLTDRPIRDEYGDVQPALVAGGAPDVLISLTRSGWPNPTGRVRSDLARVAYGLDGDRLVRAVWPQLDRVAGMEPLRAELLSGVQTVDLRFLDAEGRWQDTWPPLGVGREADPGLPRALELVISHERWGRIRRLIRLPG